MEIQSKQGPMVGWAIWKDVGNSKVTGTAKLTQQELEEVILDTEIKWNNQPLMYIHYDIQFLVLTPNIECTDKQLQSEEQFDDDDEVM